MGAARSRLLKLVATVVIYGALFFQAAGRFDSHAAWTYLIVWLLCIGLRFAVLWIRDPELLNERGKWKADTRRFDEWLLRLMTPLMFAIAVVAGLDVRFGWSAPPPIAAWIAIAVFLCGEAIVLWSMLHNTHFESTVRLQTDRGHQVVSSGPYRVVRHPGYVGAILMYASMPIALASYWGLAPALSIVGLFILRAALEDRMLHAELPGYAEYAERTRSRLLPGVW